MSFTDDGGGPDDRGVSAGVLFGVVLLVLVVAVLLFYAYGGTGVPRVP